MQYPTVARRQSRRHRGHTLASRLKASTGTLPPKKRLRSRVVILIAVATVVTFVAVTHRYAAGFAVPGVQDALLKLNFSWAQELSIFLLVWMAKFGAAYGVRTGIHVGVDVLINRLPETWRRKSVLLGLSGGILFTAVVGTFGARLVWRTGLHYALLKFLGLDVGDMSPGSTTEDLELPIWIEYAAVPLASFLMCFRFAQVGWTFARGGELPHHDHAHVEGIEEQADMTIAGGAR